MAIRKYMRRPKRTDGDGGFNPMTNEEMNLRLTCACCQAVCAANEDERKENYRLLKNSGCVIQRENGDIVVLPPEKAAEEFEKMDPAHKALYTGTEP
jgi:hypothetical protein